MDRRTPLTVGSVGMAMTLLTVAASSDQARIWITPTEIRPKSSSWTDTVIVIPPSPVPSDQVAWPSWIIALMQLVGVLLICLVAVTVAFVLLARPFPKLGWRRLRLRLRKFQQVAPLPEVTERELTIDIDAARAALSSGNARNAIVACWIQLESDAAEVGLPRMTAETPAEYVERVVVASSIDAAPIKELAALYREARFSVHELSDDDRAKAMDALHRVATSLRRKQMVPV